jgi:thiamine-phosphate pyrophosphorylase
VRDGGSGGVGASAEGSRERIRERQREAVSASRAAPRLMVITDLGIADVEATCRRVERAIAAGDARAIVVGLRDHGSSVRTRSELGRRLLAIVRRAGARLIVHDRVDLAAALEADGVQLGRASVSPVEARSLLGEAAIVGCSCHDARELAAAAHGGATFATLSPLCTSPGKGTPLGVERFRALRATVDVPVLALGGIERASLEQARDAGAVGVAAIRAVIGADDPAPFVEAVFRVFG